MRARARLVSGRSTRTTSSRSGFDLEVEHHLPGERLEGAVLALHDDAPAVAHDAELLRAGA